MRRMALTKQTPIVVLLGGTSSEREISLKSGNGVVKALQGGGYTAVTPLDLTADIPAFVAALTAHKPAVLFNALHGTDGEDGAVQGLLKLMHLPVTHSGVLASALAMDKAVAKQILRSVGLDVPHGLTCTKEALSAALGIALPVVVKPVADGSSFGVTLVHNDNEYQLAANAVRSDQPLLVEEFIPGREFTVPVLGNRALPVIEIVPKPESPFYDFASKYTDALHADFVVPAVIPETLTRRLQDMALKAHTALGCSGVSRTDFRYDPSKDRAVILEVNSQPGMTALSLVPASAAAAGISYLQVVEFLLREALEPNHGR